jgi:hypothetical protein
LECGAAAAFLGHLRVSPNVHPSPWERLRWICQRFLPEKSSAFLSVKSATSGGRLQIFHFFCKPRHKKSGAGVKGGIDKLGDFLQKEELRTCPRNQEDSHLRVGFSFANGRLSFAIHVTNKTEELVAIIR